LHIDQHGRQAETHPHVVLFILPKKSAQADGETAWGDGSPGGGVNRTPGAGTLRIDLDARRSADMARRLLIWEWQNNRTNPKINKDSHYLLIFRKIPGQMQINVTDPLKIAAMIGEIPATEPSRDRDIGAQCLSIAVGGGSEADLSAQ
jgi:hypothetical protein